MRFEGWVQKWSLGAGWFWGFVAQGFQTQVAVKLASGCRGSLRSVGQGVEIDCNEIATFVGTALADPSRSISIHPPIHG